MALTYVSLFAGIGGRQALRALGNAVVPHQGAVAMATLFEEAAA